MKLKTKMIAAAAFLASVSSAYALEDYRPFAYLPTATSVASTDMVKVLVSPSTDPAVKQITVANFSAYLGTLGGFINLDLGSSGVAGSLDVFPATATRGKFTVSAVNNDANTTTTLTNAAMGQASVISIPDPGAATANVVLTSAANDGAVVAATSVELDYNNITTLGTAEASKTVTADASLDTTGQRNITATGTVQAEQLTTTDDATVTDDLAVGGLVTVAEDITVTADATGGNAGARSKIVGLPALKLKSLGTMVNGTTETISYIDATPTGEWAEVDAGTNVAITADTTYYRDSTNSVKIAFGATAVENDGVDGTITQDNLTANESIGFWLMTSADTASGDLDLTIDDTDGTDQAYVLPATVANVWEWVELDISGCDGNCDTADGIHVLLTAQGAAAFGVSTGTPLNVYLDAMYKWDADNEEALGSAIVQDGVLSVAKIVTDQAQPNTPSDLAEYTDYFVHYESGSDFIVTVTDQSAASGIALIATE